MNIRDELERTFAELSGDLKSQKFDKDLDKRVLDFQQATQQSPFFGKLKEDLPLVHAFASVGQKCATMCSAWIDNLEIHRKNLKFRDSFDNSLIVYVYGKVKSGKSALGNFMAYGKHNPLPEEIAAKSQVHFDVALADDIPNSERVRIETLVHQMQKQRKFMVDMLECTSCIQYFRKRGLTWVDSPGIHSTTAANGKLAREYLESADIVIYTTTSRSACQDADIKELVSIAQSGKPFVLAVTRCDEPIADIDDNGRVIRKIAMRSPKDCADIRDYCINMLTESLQGQTASMPHERLESDTILLSCLYAEQNPSEEGWKQSGMTALAKRLIDIANSDAKRMKLNAPLHVMLTHIDKLRDDLKLLENDMSKAQSAAQKLQNHVQRACKTHAYHCKTFLQKEIEELVQKNYGDNDTFRKEALCLGENALKEKQKKLIDDILTGTDEMFSAIPFEPDFSAMPEFQDIEQTITYHSSSKRGWGAVLGAVAGGALLALSGPAGWTAAAIATAAAGAGAGATVGGFVGSKLDGSKSSKIKVGDNRQDVTRALVMYMSEQVETHLHKTGTIMLENCTGPLLVWLGNLAVSCAGLDKTLDNHKKEILEMMYV